MNQAGQTVWSALYFAYGAIETELINRIQQPLRFQGQYHDRESELHYNRHRYYNPQTARFITFDPIGLAGGLNNTQYVPNPTGWFDPLGLQVKKNGVPENTKPDFYVGPDGPEATLPATGYRYMSLYDKNGNGMYDAYAILTMKYKKAPVTYFGFNKYSSGRQARDAFQVKGPPLDGYWSDSRLLGEFDTLQLFNKNGSPKVRVPRMFGDTEGMPLEPFTKAYPEYGRGGTLQLHADGLEIIFKRLKKLPE